MGGGGNGEPGGACEGRGRWTWGGGGVAGSAGGGRERWWRGLGVRVVYARRGEGEVDMGRRWRSRWRPGEQERREWVVEARWRCGECGRRGRVCCAWGERERRRLRDRASSLESGQSGGVSGSWGASHGAAWYWGGEEVPRRPWIRHIGVWWRQRLVVWVE